MEKELFPGRLMGTFLEWWSTLKDLSIPDPQRNGRIPLVFEAINKSKREIQEQHLHLWAYNCSL